MIEPFEKARNRYRIDFGLVAGILGGLIFFLGLSMLVPLGVAWLYHENSWSSFLITASGAMAMGGLLFALFRPRQELRIREVFLIVSLTWLIGSFVGAIPFTHSGALVSYTDAVFESMSG